MIMNRPDGTVIETWQGWTRPKKDIHWKAGRSAMELAKAWFRNDTLSPPAELIAALATISDASAISIVSGVPERVTQLPERGEGRNHDLALIAMVGTKQATICIEAKADEPFGSETIAQYLETCKNKTDAGIATRAGYRIAHLLALLGVAPDEIFASPWLGVRYQLLAAVCGTAKQAEIDGSAFSVLIVHEFRTESTLEDNLIRNDADFRRFINVLGGNGVGYVPGTLVGPFTVDDIDCWVGKVITTV